MISKVFSGHSFRPACRYVMNKPEAKILAGEGVRINNADRMADDFSFQQQCRPAKRKACFHAVLSFPPTENPDDEKLIQIAKEYLDEIGFKDTQYAIVKHSDRAHPHLHILANYVNNHGEAISDQWIGSRAKKAAQKLTAKYGLTPAIGKNPKLMHPERLHQAEKHRYQIYKAIHKLRPFCRNMNELESLLKKRGINTIYKYKGETKERQGISFQLGEYTFKGSKVDRSFSLGKLEGYFSNKMIINSRPKKFQFPEKRNGNYKSDKSRPIINPNLFNTSSNLPLIINSVNNEVPEPRKKKRKKKRRYH